MKKCSYPLLLLFYFVTFFSHANSNVAVTLYDGKGYTGESLGITGDIGDLGTFDNKMSSFKISPNYEVRLYKDKDFKGSYYSLKSTVDDVSFASKIDNSISSVSILKYPTSLPVAVTVYTGLNYTGSKMYVRGSTATLGSFNKKMKSFKLGKGFGVQFHMDTNYKGEVFTRSPQWSPDPSDFGKHNIGIQSVKIIERGDGLPVGPIKGNAGSGGTGTSSSSGSGTSTTAGKKTEAQLESECRTKIAYIYGGAFRKGTKVGLCYGIPDISKTAMGQNWVASYGPEVSGYYMRFHKRPNYQGGFYTRDQTNVDRNTFNGNVGSVEILRNSSADTIMTIYSHPNYASDHMSITLYDTQEGIERRVSDFGIVGSAKIRSGYKATICEIDYTGNGSTVCNVVEKNRPLLHGPWEAPFRTMGSVKIYKRQGNDWVVWQGKGGDQIGTISNVPDKDDSSLISDGPDIGQGLKELPAGESPPPDRPAVRLFNSGDYSGSDYATINVDTPDLRSRSFDNKTSSLEVYPCFRVMVYADANYRGKSKELRPGKHKAPWNNSISSVKITKKAIYDGDWVELNVGWMKLGITGGGCM